MKKHTLPVYVFKNKILIVINVILHTATENMEYSVGTQITYVYYIVHPYIYVM